MRDRRCPSTPKIRGESCDTIDKLRPIIDVDCRCRSFDSLSPCTADWTMSLGRFTITVSVSVRVSIALANIKITDEEALQTAANGGAIDLYVKLSFQDPQTLLRLTRWYRERWSGIAGPLIERLEYVRYTSMPLTDLSDQ